MRSSPSLHFASFIVVAFVLVALQDTHAQQVKVSATLLPAPILPATSSVPPVISPPSATAVTTVARFFSTTISENTAIAVGGAGVGTKLEMPANLVITASAWDGTVNVSYSTAVPATVPEVVSAKVVSVDFGGMAGVPIQLSSASIITVPYPNFANTANSVVKIIDAAGVTFSLGACSASQYVSPGQLDKPDSYLISSYAKGGAQHCYKYDSENVYVASNHFTSFLVGVAAPVVSPTPVSASTGSSGGGGGGGGSVQFFSSSPVVLSPPPTISQPSQPSPISPPIRVLSQPSVRPACRFTSVQPQKKYNDVPLNTWYSAAVTRLGDISILQKAKPFFLPTAPLRRYEALQLSMEAFGIKPVSKLNKNPFTDVVRKDSFAKHVMAALDAGIISSGVSSFFPRRIINRAEAVSMLLRAGRANIKDYTNRTFSYYRDVPLDQWYFPYITKASDLCIIVGYSDFTVRPSQVVTRAEFVVMLDRAVQRLRK